MKLTKFKNQNKKIFMKMTKFKNQNKLMIINKIMIIIWRKIIKMMNNKMFLLVFQKLKMNCQMMFNQMNYNKIISKKKN